MQAACTPRGRAVHASHIRQRAPGPPAQLAQAGQGTCRASPGSTTRQDRFATIIRLVHRPAADIISAVEFDGTGDFLATGDHGGRVVLFERLEPEPAEVRGSTGCLSLAWMR